MRAADSKDGIERPLGEQHDLLEQIRNGLHEMCQPLSTLQCMLELGSMEETFAEAQSCIVGALTQCSRMNTLMGVMREAVAGAARARDAGAV